MADLPTIGTATKIALAGTYIAEQTSTQSYDLVNATYHEHQQAQKNPTTPTIGKRRRVQRQENNNAQCTVLPALASIDPLLSIGSSRQQNEKQDKRAAREKQIQETREKGHKATERLYHHKSGRSGLVSQMTQMSDMDTLAWLTRPGTGKPQRRLKDVREEELQWERVSESRKGKRTHNTHRDLFQKSLQGTDFECPLGSPSKFVKPTGNRSKHKKDVKERMDELRIDIVPENAVEAYFSAEAAMQEETQKLRNNAKLMKKVQDLADKAKENCGSIVAPRPTRPNVPEQSSDLWGDLLADLVPSSQKLTPMRKEACEALRMLVFGYIGNEEAKTPKEKEAIFYETIGTREKVKTLYVLWRKLDDDHSGRVDFTEFQSYVQRTGQEKLAEKAQSALLGKKSSFAIEDMMKIIWPLTTFADMKVMRQWGIESLMSTVEDRVETPVVLPLEEFNGLCENFRYFDRDNKGVVSFEQLTASGLLDKEQADRYRREWDPNGVGALTCLEFCQMLCPSGFRAFQEALTASDKEGNRLVYEEVRNQWVPASDTWVFSDKERAVSQHPVTAGLAST